MIVAPTARQIPARPADVVLVVSVARDEADRKRMRPLDRNAQTGPRNEVQDEVVRKQRPNHEALAMTGLIQAVVKRDRNAVVVNGDRKLDLIVLRKDVQAEAVNLDIAHRKCHSVALDEDDLISILTHAVMAQVAIDPSLALRAVITARASSLVLATSAMAVHALEIMPVDMVGTTPILVPDTAPCITTDLAHKAVTTDRSLVNTVVVMDTVEVLPMDTVVISQVLIPGTVRYIITDRDHPAATTDISLFRTVGASAPVEIMRVDMGATIPILALDMVRFTITDQLHGAAIMDQSLASTAVALDVARSNFDIMPVAMETIVPTSAHARRARCMDLDSAQGIAMTAQASVPREETPNVTLMPAFLVTITDQISDHGTRVQIAGDLKVVRHLEALVATSDGTLVMIMIVVQVAAPIHAAPDAIPAELLKAPIANDDRNSALHTVQVVIARAWARWDVVLDGTDRMQDLHEVKVEVAPNSDHLDVDLNEAGPREDRKADPSAMAKQIRLVAVGLIVTDANSVPEPIPDNNATNPMTINLSMVRWHPATTNNTEENLGTIHPSCASVYRNSSSRRVFVICRSH